MDIIGTSRRAFMNSAAIALGAASKDASVRSVAADAINRGFMRHMLMPGLYGMGGGAAAGMGGSLIGGAFNGDMPTFGQVLGSGFRGAFFGGLTGGAGGGLYRLGAGGFAGQGALTRNAYANNRVFRAHAHRGSGLTRGQYGLGMSMMR